ncbi:hypothetical protein HK405_004070, partial [Cladochytrium tenue]
MAPHTPSQQFSQQNIPGARPGGVSTSPPGGRVGGETLAQQLQSQLPIQSGQPGQPQYLQQPPPQQGNSMQGAVASLPTVSPPPQPQDVLIPVREFFSSFVLASAGTPAAARAAQAAATPDDDVFAAVYAHLAAARLPPRDARVLVVPGIGPAVCASPRGLRVLENFRDMRARGRAAVAIQKTYRGWKVRKQLRDGVASGAAIGANLEVNQEQDLQQQQQQERQQQQAAPVDAKEEKDREKAERRRSKILILKKHLTKISTMYQEVLAIADSQQPDAGGAPTELELEFMQLLNSEETFRLSANLRALHRLEKPSTMEEAQRYYEERGGIPGGRSPAVMYDEYATRVVDWIAAVLVLNLPAGTDLVSLVRSGDVLCQLAVAMYPKVACQLLTKGPEFTVHKVIFFLELCKTVGIKSAMLFSVSDILLGGAEDDPMRKSALTVLRTICALERQARRKGWKGPAMMLKPEGSAGDRRRSRLSVLQQMDEAGGGLVRRQSTGSRRSRSSQSERRLSSMSTGSAGSGRRLSTLSTGSSSGAGGGGGIRGRSNSRSGGTNAGGARSGSTGPAGATSGAAAAPGSEDAVLPPAATFRSLSRERKMETIRSVSVRTARESLFSYYTGGYDQDDEYAELLAVVAEREAAEARALEKEAEKAARKEAEAARKTAALIARTRAIRKLLHDEEAYVHNLTTVAEYLSHLVSRRRRLSKRHSRGLPALESFDPSATAATSGGDLYAPKPGETATKAELRVEAENEELVLLHRVVEDLVALHEGLVADVRVAMEDAGVSTARRRRRRGSGGAAAGIRGRGRAGSGGSNGPPTAAVLVDDVGGDEDDDMYVDDDGDGDGDDAEAAAADAVVVRAGDALMRFAADAALPYITYAVVALERGGAGASGEVLAHWSGTGADSAGAGNAVPGSAVASAADAVVGDSAAAAGAARAEFLARVVARFVGERYAGAGAADGSAAGSGAISSAEWSWYLARPLARLARYADAIATVLAAAAAAAASAAATTTATVVAVDGVADTAVATTTQSLRGVAAEPDAERRRAMRDDMRLRVAL